MFYRLLIQGRPDEIEACVESLKQIRSTLDFVSQQSRRVNDSLSAAQRQIAGSIPSRVGVALWHAARPGILGRVMSPGFHFVPSFVIFARCNL